MKLIPTLIPTYHDKDAAERVKNRNAFGIVYHKVTGKRMRPLFGLGYEE